MILRVNERSQVQILVAPDPGCRCVPARSSGAPMTTSALPWRRRSPPLTLPRARSSDRATGAVAARRTASPRVTSRPTFRPTSRRASSWTATRSARRRRTGTDSPGSRVGRFTSPWTLASWLDQVATLSRSDGQKVRRGVHRSPGEPERAVGGYIETVLESPEPFRRRKTAEGLARQGRNNPRLARRKEDADARG